MEIIKGVQILLPLIPLREKLLQKMKQFLNGNAPSRGLEVNIEI
jgi:hypothetical protein